MELKSSKHTEDASALQKTADFIQAFMLGFEVQVSGVFRGIVPVLLVRGGESQGVTSTQFANESTAGFVPCPRACTHDGKGEEGDSTRVLVRRSAVSGFGNDACRRHRNGAAQEWLCTGSQSGHGGCGNFCLVGEGAHSEGWPQAEFDGSMLSGLGPSLGGC